MNTPLFLIAWFDVYNRLTVDNANRNLPKVPRCNEAGVALIKDSEGCKLEAYQDSKGVWTIGWGHTGPEVIKGLVWTEEQAEAAFRKDILVSELAVRKHVKIPLNENEFSALVSFCYNFGETKFRTSELLKFLNKNETVNAVKQWRRWDKVYVKEKPEDPKGKHKDPKGKHKDPKGKHKDPKGKPKDPKGGFIVLEGLKKRRKQEIMLFLTPVSTPPLASTRNPILCRALDWP